MHISAEPPLTVQSPPIVPDEQAQSHIGWQWPLNWNWVPCLVAASGGGVNSCVKQCGVLPLDLGVVFPNNCWGTIYVSPPVATRAGLIWHQLPEETLIPCSLSQSSPAQQTSQVVKVLRGVKRYVFEPSAMRGKGREYSGGSGGTRAI